MVNHPPSPVLSSHAIYPGEGEPAMLSALLSLRNTLSQPVPSLCKALLSA